MHLDVRPPVRLSIVRPATNWPLLQSATVTSFRRSPPPSCSRCRLVQLANRDPSLYRMTATHVAPTRKPITVGGSEAAVGDGDWERRTYRRLCRFRFLHPILHCAVATEQIGGGILLLARQSCRRFDGIRVTLPEGTCSEVAVEVILLSHSNDTHTLTGLSARPCVCRILHPRSGWMPHASNLGDDRCRRTSAAVVAIRMHAAKSL